MDPVYTLNYDSYNQELFTSRMSLCSRVSWPKQSHVLLADDDVLAADQCGQPPIDLNATDADDSRHATTQQTRSTYNPWTDNASLAIQDSSTRKRTLDAGAKCGCQRW
jgi:hypothetical protein